MITGMSNAANITDGMDGLAGGISAIVSLGLFVLCLVAGKQSWAQTLLVPHVPGADELAVLAGAMGGACLGFLWWNCSPAQVFMGDTGSLAIGGIIAVFAIIIKKELLLPILCGVFFMESLSVIMQVTWFKYTKRKYGEGRRIFLMSPLHHHYQKKGYPEPKIVSRFWIVTLMLAVLAIITLKLR